MPLSVYAVKLLALAQTLHRWLTVLTGLDRANRERIAEYAEMVAATLGRASHALHELDADPADQMKRLAALRELGRITGYVETIVGVLEQHLDGRKIAGVKRRLERLGVEQLSHTLSIEAGPLVQGPSRMDRLAAAEGYFRALADGLRA